MNLVTELSWKKILSEYFNSDSFVSLSKFIDTEYQAKTIYPKQVDIFSALDLCPFNELSVVILGQDPYHGAGQAHGLSFSVPDTIQAPPSLRNILKELESDLSKNPIVENDLSSWTKQGVLLLNSVLTVEESKPGSHANKGWEDFTDHVIQEISERKKNCVFILWGAYAQKKEPLIDESKHLVLKSPHPSPLSSYRGFFGSKPFSQTNSYLIKNNKHPIDW